MPTPRICSSSSCSGILYSLREFCLEVEESPAKPTTYIPTSSYIYAAADLAFAYFAINSFCNCPGAGA